MHIDVADSLHFTLRHCVCKSRLWLSMLHHNTNTTDITFHQRSSSPSQLHLKPYTRHCLCKPLVRLHSNMPNICSFVYQCSSALLHLQVIADAGLLLQCHSTSSIATTGANHPCSFTARHITMPAAANRLYSLASLHPNPLQLHITAAAPHHSMLTWSQPHNAVAAAFHSI